jgi:hypothetical protein
MVCLVIHATQRCNQGLRGPLVTLCLSMCGFGKCLANRIKSNRTRGRRDDDSNHSWILEIDAR